MSYENYIERSILVNNEYGITEVRGLTSFKEMGLIRSDYEKIVELIKKEDALAIQNWPSNLMESSEFLIIMTFIDQSSNGYIVTTYDNELIYQDPQVVEIFRWKVD